MQGSYVTYPSRPLSWSKGLKLKQYVTTHHMVGRTDNCIMLKRSICLSVGASLMRGSKVKPLRVSAFKGSAQNDKSGVDGILEEEPPPKEISETEHDTQNKERDGILRMVWSNFLGLNATIKIPLLIFIPGYLAVNIIYGAEVSKELTPLWVLGPLIVALYIKMLQWLCALYVFSFKQTVQVIKNLPTYYMVAYRYIAQGKLKEDIRACFWQPVLNIKNLDYKKLSRRKLKGLQELIVEKYLDFIESIWPYYCRTIRFLKRANLI
ncbi:uncharacterized protein Pyn_14515 [Prunus yedoensis var. nudiflora]|uniref:Embryo defective 2759 n=1 Tax=Prunus yedoensis var. nudiflora TaxID=2094558 RepID=A0A314XW92_PRUYE|nr:uncharacterized protein Pyn_14515 [Prunus yedoensis var. nudiflora]